MTNVRTITCPFDLCTATVELLPFRLDPKTDVRTDFVKPHEFEPDTYGPCPMSLQRFPVVPEFEPHLVSARESIRKLRQRAQPDRPSGHRGHTRRHTLAPRETASRWFDPAGGDVPHAGPSVESPRLPLRFLFQPGKNDERE